MHSVRNLVVIPVWLGLTLLTIRAMIAFRRSTNARYAYRYGMMQFGVSGWIITIFVGLVVWPDPGPDTLIKATWLAFFLFPICMWAGYLWARGMRAILPSIWKK